MGLLEKKCAHCSPQTPILSDRQTGELLKQLVGWQIEQSKFLTKSYKTADFACALALANDIGALAEHEGHHPDLIVRWGQLTVNIYTHAIDGLSESDFILAAKIDQKLK